MSSDAISQGINAHLEQENERLRRELDEVRAMLSRPVNVVLQNPQQSTLTQISQYLPQLTNIATNLSYVASAIQSVDARLDAIAKKLEPKPYPRTLSAPTAAVTGSSQMSCRCDGPTHTYTQGWCPPGGPVR